MSSSDNQLADLLGPDWYFYSCNWWKALWENEPGMAITMLRERAA